MKFDREDALLALLIVVLILLGGVFIKQDRIEVAVESAPCAKYRTRIAMPDGSEHWIESDPSTPNQSEDSAQNEHLSRVDHFTGKLKTRSK